MQILGLRFSVLDEIDSTNNYAMQLIENNQARHGDVWYARYQSQGKGQRGKQWQSEKDKNIHLSIVLKADEISISNTFYLLAAMALAARNFFAKYVYDDKKVKLKWPNDIYWGDIKAGGILIENKINGQNWQWSVVGFGININQEVFEGQISNKAISLKMITGIDFNVEELARELSNEAYAMYSIFLAGEYQQILKQYNSHLYKRSEKVRLKKKNVGFVAEIVGVNNAGKLLAKNGMLQEFDFGEVSWEL